jgi:hypothetical protein
MLQKRSAGLHAGAVLFGVADGARTHDNRNHNPGLYQLSYSHRREKIITADGYCVVAAGSSFLGSGFATLISTLNLCFSDS